MAMRRPRIKAAANLVNIKRKNKVAESSKDIAKKDESATAHKELDNSLKIDKTKLKIKPTLGNKQEVQSNENANNSSAISLITKANPNSNYDLSTQPTKEIQDESTFKDQEKDLNTNGQNAAARNVTVEPAFKAPHKVEHQNIYNLVQNIKTEVDNVVDVEDNILQIDLQRTNSNFPMSPSKQQVRSRIRPSPIMGQRRNSYIGCSTSPHINDDSSNDFVMFSSRRERYNSTSLSTYNSLAGSASAYSPHKYVPTMTQARTRTESTCSTYSDAYNYTAHSAQQSLTTQRIKRAKSEHYNRIQWRREYESRCTNGIPDKTRLKMLDLIFYNPASNPMPTKTANTTMAKSIREKKEQEYGSMEEKCVKPINATVPQLKLNANNELVLDDKSLEIETTAEQEARKILANTSLLFIDENTGTNGFYKRHKRTREWPSDETVKFYRCLQTVGTDFSLMAQLFPNRTRRELKLKFKREERCNGVLINKALLYPKSFNVEELKSRLEADEQQMKEEALQWRKIQQLQVSQIKKIKLKNSKAERVLKNGLDVYENEHLPIKKLSNRASLDDSCDPLLSAKTKQILKTHIENSVAKRIPREITDLINIVQKRGRARKHDSIANNRKLNTRKNRSKTKLCDAKSDENNQFSLVTDVNVLEQELSNILETSDNVQHDMQTVSHIDASGRKTLVDLDNGQAVSVLEEHEQVLDDSNVHKESIAIDTTTNITKFEAYTINEETPISSDIVEADEEAVQRILQQIEEGGLVLVSSIDDNNENIDEIFMIDKRTGDLCEKPLDLPQDIVQIISELVSS